MLGDNIRKYRKTNNLSQEKLAETLGVSRQTISLWETGKTQPSVDILANLAGALGVSVDILLIEEPQQECNEDAGQTPHKDREKVVGLKVKTKEKRRWNYILIVLAIILVIGVAFTVWQLFFNNPPFVDNPTAIENASQSVVMINCYDNTDDLFSTGSGFVAFSDDIVITNYHVIDFAARILISTEQDMTYSVERVIAYDVERDIAILQVEQHTELIPLQLGESKNIKKGQEIVAIGSPLGIKNSVSTGVISGRIRNANSAIDVLQFTAPISSGSSGGALFNTEGEVIGVTYASFENGQNINLAIPTEEVQKLFQQAQRSKSLAEVYNTVHPGHKLFMESEIVSFDDLLANPEEYDGKLISVLGFAACVDDGNSRIYLIRDKNSNSLQGYHSPRDYYDYTYKRFLYTKMIRCEKEKKDLRTKEYEHEYVIVCGYFSYWYYDGSANFEMVFASTAEDLGI